MTNEDLIHTASKMRIEVLRMLINAGSGHAAGSLSAADIFTYLYFDFLKHDPVNPDWEDRDYFLLSNGHICPIWYTCLAFTGYFPPDELQNLRKFGSILQGHPWNIKTPGVFNSSGPLGHGGGQAVGTAIGLKIDSKPNKVICYLSDGEQQEGATWEAVMCAYKYKLDNLTFIIDANDIQIDGSIDDIMPLSDKTQTTAEGIVNKYKSFNWNAMKINGHSFDEIRHALSKDTFFKDRPRVIVAETVAGKGVSFMENQSKYHDWRGDNDLAKEAIQELERRVQ